MRPHVKTAAALAMAAFALSPSAARAQVDSALDRVRGIPAGMALPVIGAAAAEEPSALGTNPAGIGFVRQLALQYFHEGAVTPGAQADGFWTATALGPLGLGWAEEWMRPGDVAADALYPLERRYRRTTFALALSDGRSSSLAVCWHWIASPDPAVRRAGGWDAGLTLRPARWFSAGAAALGLDARLAGARLPRRYDLGVATRILEDTLTLSADLLADDRARDDFSATHLAFGAGAELRSGFGAGVQVQIPIRRQAGVAGDTSALFAVTWNAAHGGWTGASAALPGSTSWLVGARVSSERYRAAASGDDAPIIDLDDVLSPPRTFFLVLSDRDPYGTLLRRLGEAAEDPEVGAVVLDVDSLPIGTGRVEELRAKIAEIRKKKPVLAYLSGGGQREYYLACAATAVGMPPASTLIMNGISTSTLFLKEGLARLGVSVEVAKAGAYKSAPEPLTRTDMSPEAREAATAVLDDAFNREVSAIAEARRLSPERVQTLVDRGLFSPEEAKAAGLLDAVLWPDEIEGWARRVSGRRVSLQHRYEPDPPRSAQRWGSLPAIALVRVEGAIAQGRSRRDPLGLGGIAGSDTLRAEIRRAAEDRSIRAIVVRIDSPGGDGLASDLVWREIVRARRSGKPVIASMGDVAASGGYLIAAGADQIIAEPSTLTGSIGVFALKPDLSGALQKLSIKREALSRGEKAQLFSLARHWTAPERKAVEDQVQAFYRAFIERVAEGRHLSAAEAESLAGGRVWTGRQAFDRRLVDLLGSLDDAVALAKEKAGIPRTEPVEIRRMGGGASRAADIALGAMAEAASPTSALLRAAGALPEIRTLALLSEMGPVLALPLPWFELGGAP